MVVASMEVPSAELRRAATKPWLLLLRLDGYGSIDGSYDFLAGKGFDSEMQGG